MYKSLSMSDICSERQDYRQGCCSSITDLYCGCLQCLIGTACCLWNCHAGSFLNICCCHCNCVIFPGSQDRIGNIHRQDVEYLHFINKYKQSVPYIQLSNQTSRNKNEFIIYFHGNSQNIAQSLQMARPIFDSTQITTLIIEYPTYGSYISRIQYNLADKIKSNSLEFHELIKLKYNVLSQNIYIVGRSIGSGPACDLASRVKCKKLMLISPFDSIKQVAKQKIGSLGCMIHDHFNNMDAMQKYKGQLLVIHGKRDEVINIENGHNLVRVYERQNRQCVFIQPPRMSHNYFQIQPDIVQPITKFLK